MNKLVAVSSKTGNTRKVAAAISDAIADSKLIEIEDAPLALDEYGFVAVGFWLDSGHADDKALSIIKTLRGKNVALFGTLGGDPSSAEAQKVMDETVSYLHESNNLVGTMWCRGRISQSVLSRMYELYPKIRNDKKHLERVALASSHPDEQDLVNAALNARKWMECLNESV